jgi:hypothetical protein
MTGGFAGNDPYLITTNSTHNYGALLFTRFDPQ